MEVKEFRHYNGLHYWYEISTFDELAGAGIMPISKLADGRTCYRVTSKAYARMGRPK